MTVSPGFVAEVVAYWRHLTKKIGEFSAELARKLASSLGE